MVFDRQELGFDGTRDLVEDSIRRGLAAYHHGNFADAAQQLEEVLLRSERQTPDLWERLGSAYMEIRDFERGIDVLERLVSASLATAQIYGQLATCALELGHFDESVRYREAAIDKRPDDPTLWRDLGIARRRAGLTREAVIAFREAMRLDPTDEAGVGLEYGRALRELDDPEKAVAVYREALARHADRSDLWSDLAILYSEMGLFAESDLAVREAIRLKPNNAAAWHTIATNTLKKGQRDTAQKAYERMKELNPDFADEILSWVASTAGVAPDDLAAPAPAAALAPASVVARSRRGRLLHFRSRP